MQRLYMYLFEAETDTCSQDSVGFLCSTFVGWNICSFFCLISSKFIYNPPPAFKKTKGVPGLKCKVIFIMWSLPLLKVVSLMVLVCFFFSCQTYTVPWGLRPLWKARKNFQNLYLNWCLDDIPWVNTQKEMVNNDELTEAISTVKPAITLLNTVS